MSTDDEVSQERKQGAAVPDRRAAAMCEMRAEGRSLQAIALQFGLTRERVRQIIRDAGGPGKAEAVAARTQRATQERGELRDRALGLCRQRPGLAVEELAAELGASAQDVRAALGDDARRLLVTSHQASVLFSDDDILGHIRRAAAQTGEPLTVRMYDAVRGEFGGASSPLVLQRFGSWRVACVRAGVRHGQPLRSEYRRRWSTDQLIDSVADYLGGEDTRGSFADYERWARTVPGAPSGQTIRTQLGAWSRAKSLGLTRLAARGDGQAGETPPGAAGRVPSAQPDEAAPVADGEGADGEGADGEALVGEGADGAFDGEALVEDLSTAES